jgi:hypothetical protein
MARSGTNSEAFSFQSPADGKLAELVLYVSRMSEGDETYDSAKLNKLLFFADFQAYIQLGRSITGQEYQALDRGPAPRRLAPVRDELKAKGYLALREDDYYGRRQLRPLALRRPDTSLFDRDELEIVDRLLRHFWGVTATRMNDLSHEFIGWELATEGETIPYDIALVGSRKPSPDERRRGIELETVARACLAGRAK